MLGTAAYLAPEQARGEEAGPRPTSTRSASSPTSSCPGRLPYEASSLTELALKQQSEPPDAAARARPGVPPALAAAVAVALAMDPSQRYASAAGDGRGAGRRAARHLPRAGRGHGRHEPLAAEDETAATRMLEGSPRTEAPVRPRQPRRPRPPVEPVAPPAVRDRDAAAADRRRQRDRRPRSAGAGSPCSWSSW